MLFRRLVAWTFVGTLATTAIVTVLFGRWEWTWSEDYGVKFAALGAVFAVGTFALATIGGVIALAAYIASIQPPSLSVSLLSPDWPPNEPEVVLDVSQLEGEGFARLWVASEFTIHIENANRFSARLPACGVHAHCFALGSAFYRSGEDWSILSYREGFPDHVQWDGGANYAIHGESRREIHIRPANGAAWSNERKYLEVELTAEGFKKSFEFDVAVLSPAEFEVKYPQRGSLLPGHIRGQKAPPGF